MHLFRDLRDREKAKHPIHVGMVGAGFLGAGVIRQLVHSPGIRPSIVANRTLEKAAEALKRSGVDSRKIRHCEDAFSAERAIRRNEYVISSNLHLPSQIPLIEAVVETTGNLLVGSQIAFEALEARKHFVAANPETQATVGAILQQKAREAGVIYSDIDGDQPGILKKLYDYVEGIGFTPMVAGNCKGVMKRYATPETQAAYCREYPIKPWIATAAADGTKLSIEMCLVANSTEMLPAQTGMTGVQTTLETLVEDFHRAGLFDKGPLVEYTLGIPVGVFVIGYHADPWIREEMNYLKMGSGPYYLFFSPHVLCQFDIVPSVAEAVLYHHAVIAPKESPMTEVVTVAKRDLSKDRLLDGIGGFDCYGLLASRAEAQEHGWLPIGLAEFMRLRHKISKDEPIRMEDVEFVEENQVISLRRKQEELYPPKRTTFSLCTP